MKVKIVIAVTNKKFNYNESECNCNNNLIIVINSESIICNCRNDFETNHFFILLFIANARILKIMSL